MSVPGWKVSLCKGWEWLSRVASEVPMVSEGRNTDQGEQWGCRGAGPCQPQGGAETVLPACTGSHGTCDEGDWSVVGGQEPSQGAGQVPGWSGQCFEQGGGAMGEMQATRNRHGNSEMREALRLRLRPSLKWEEEEQQI